MVGDKIEIEITTIDLNLMDMYEIAESKRIYHLDEDYSSALLKKIVLDFDEHDENFSASLVCCENPINK